MADNFLENHYEEYEQRKAQWLKKKRHMPKSAKVLHRPDDEAL